MVETFELPLFPLHTVLFPGMYLPLHIFEERYKEMINFCLTTKQPFGVVCIKSGTPENGPLPEPHQVGCTALITQVHPLSDGRMNIVAVGQERFRILSLSHERPYLVGQVELAPLQVEQDIDLTPLANQLHLLTTQYLEILSRLGKIEFDITQIPTNPQTLVYLAAALLQTPITQKQQFLTENNASQLFRDLQKSYQEEIALLYWLPVNNNTSFSLN